MGWGARVVGVGVAIQSSSDGMWHSKAKTIANTSTANT
jgi:hypothetical protein